MEAKGYVVIGGSLDGQVIAMPEGRDSFTRLDYGEPNLPILDAFNEPDRYYEENYSLFRMSGTSEQCAWFEDKLSMDDAVKHLLEAYANQKGGE